MGQLSAILLFLLIGFQAQGEDKIAQEPAVATEETTVKATVTSKEILSEDLETTISNIEEEEDDPAITPSVPPMAIAKKSPKKEKQGFFSFYFTNEFRPANLLEFDNSGLVLGWGKELLLQNSLLELNVKFASSEPFFAVKYEWDFAEYYKWIPGVDTSLLFGVSQKGWTDENFHALSLGLGLGLFVKTCISKSYVVLVRSGFNYSVPVKNYYIIDPDYLNFYMSIGVRKHLKF